MINRWYHAPSLFVPAPGKEKKVGWLELFYDLIYVATIIQLGNALSDHVGLGGFLAFAGLFAPIWFTWTGFTFYANRFVVDDFVHRLLVFAQMFAIGAVAISIPEVFDGRHQAFALAYFFCRLVIVAQYGRVYLQTKQARDFTLRYTIGFAIGALLWLVSAFVAAPWSFLIWRWPWGWTSACRWADMRAA